MPAVRPLSVIAALVLAAAPALTGAAERPPVLPFPAAKRGLVSAERMRALHEEVKTPYKYGVVLRGEPGELVDCPAVFRHGDRWYMLYIAIKDEVGYQTCLARSDNLRDWEKLGRVLSFQPGRWDAWQSAGGPALYDVRWEGSHTLGTHEGRYWISYLGGAKQGYEPDPLSLGLAFTTDPSMAGEWTRLAENPVLAPDQPDARDFEAVTLYRSTVVRDEQQTLGAPYVMAYNGKSAPNSLESIGLAVSTDLRHWQRVGRGPVIINSGPASSAISGDPQLTRIGDTWVMFYFGAFWQPGAFDTFAASYDLVHWTKWDGPHLVAPSESFDRQYAHKPWVLKHEGVVYHFYCAVGDQGRVIALATSRDLRAARP